MAGSTKLCIALFGLSKSMSDKCRFRSVILRICSDRRRSGGERKCPAKCSTVQTTERYLGCKQRIRSAVYDRIGIEQNLSRRDVLEELPTIHQDS